MSIESIPFERTTPRVDALWKKHPAAESSDRELELLRLARELERLCNASYKFVNGMPNMLLGDRLAKRKALLTQFNAIDSGKA
jgi:hypothetical protein